MKVLLINPASDSPQPVMPLGLAYLGAALEKNRIPVEAIDAWVQRLDFAALGKRLKDYKEVDLIAITVMSPTYAEAARTIRVCRSACPKSKIIIGGVHPSAMPEECLKDNPELDFVAAGEGDNLIVQLVRALSGDGNLSEIKGLVYRGAGKIINNGCAEPIADLDSLPHPARHLFPLFKYQTHPPYRIYKSYATIMASRGCPFSCTYCTKSVSGQNYRAQSPRRVIEEIEHLTGEYNIRQAHFYDDNFTLDKGRTELICDEIIRRKIKILWSCVSRVDLVNSALLAKMRRAGCWLISYGVESGNQAMLDNIRKGYRIEQIKEAFRITREAGIRTLGYFMAGLPDETYSTLDDTVKLSLELNPDFVSWSITALYPGSLLYKRALKGESDESSLSPYAHGRISIYEGDIPRSFILKTVNQAYMKFYFRIGYMLRFLIRLRTLTEFFSYLKALAQFLKWMRKKSGGGVERA